MSSAPAPDTVAALMGRVRQGDRDAIREMVELFYPELHRLAASRMKNERSEHTWQPTALVNELYLELVKIKSLRSENGTGQEEKAAFFGLAAHTMRRLLIHHARPLYRRVEKVELQDSPEFVIAGAEAIQEVENLLGRLGAIDPRLRLVVEMKVFEGLSGQEIAERLGCALRTVARHWDFAKHWLQKEMAAQAPR